MQIAGLNFRPQAERFDGTNSAAAFATNAATAAQKLVVTKLKMVCPNRLPDSLCRGPTFRS
jgi:hypothetical protein